MTITKLNGLENGMEIGQKINEIIDGKADVNADTTGNAGTATKLKNARTISLTGDVTGSTTFDGSGDKSITTTLSSTISADTTGNAATATKLAASKTISLTGDVTGSASFDGSANASISTTLANSISANTTGNAATATKLANARTISLTGAVTGSASFDGSADKSISTTLANTTKIDGQWVSKVSTLSTATAIGTYTISLSSYLPNDSYNYDVSVHFAGFRNSGDTNSNISISSESITTAHDQNALPSSMFAFSSFDGNHAEAGNFSAILHIGTNRKFYFNIVQSALKYSGLYAYAYRRIGTNT